MSVIQKHSEISMIDVALLILLILTCSTASSKNISVQYNGLLNEVTQFFLNKFCLSNFLFVILGASNLFTLPKTQIYF